MTDERTAWVMAWWITISVISVVNIVVWLALAAGRLRDDGDANSTRGDCQAQNERDRRYLHAPLPCSTTYLPQGSNEHDKCNPADSLSFV